MCAGALLCGCSNDEGDPILADDYPYESEEWGEPIVLTKDHPVDSFYYDGGYVKVVYVPYAPKESVRNTVSRAIGGGDVGPLDAPVPTKIATGQYKKYYTKKSEFNWIPEYSYLLLRLDQYSFTIDLPINARSQSLYLTPKTQEGFATADVSYKGYTIYPSIRHSKGFKTRVDFYIQNGAAYDILGRQLCANRDLPLPGTSVRYSYTYELQK